MGRHTHVIYLFAEEMQMQSNTVRGGFWLWLELHSTYVQIIMYSVHEVKYYSLLCPPQICLEPDISPFLHTPKPITAGSRQDPKHLDQPDQLPIGMRGMREVLNPRSSPPAQRDLFSHNRVNYIVYTLYCTLYVLTPLPLPGFGSCESLSSPVDAERWSSGR